MYKFVVFSVIITCVTGIHDSWQSYQQDIYQSPSDIYEKGYQHGVVPGSDQCQIYKVGFTQDLYFQYIQYKTVIPDMKQFTLCFWSKFYNHSNDHPLFSYAVDGQPRAIYSWISNTERSSYFSLSVEGHTFYRLNYPLRLNRWYHTCQSWNGKTGEWQIWVNAERVGRGFHNRLVGHVIPGNGIAITGQEQSQLGGGFQEGTQAPKGSGGMLGEITMVQLYKVALTAGKAHKDHKHHHAHQFDHNGRVITTPAPTTPANRVTLPPHPLLTAGQLNRNVRLNLGSTPQKVAGQQYEAQFSNGQFVGNLVSQQLLQQQPQQQQQPQTQLFLPVQPQAQAGNVGSFSRQFVSFGSTPIVDTDLNHALGTNTAPSFDTILETHNVFKRQEENEKAAPKKRQAIYDEALLGTSGTYSFDQSLLYGLAGIGQNEQISVKQKEEEDEREPAEAEVKAVLNICTGCDEEPFNKALIFGWRTVPKKLYSGAFYTPAVAECKVF
ncbi:uncharacterized protein LOC130902300 [Diorhabda carinulata]|uniref:uncharacterized protein LOC130902300 n=1 Tax=Diorhabda carinulata TaxID=1163345 RepID=UPI0025A1C3E9|nr:uncharacterized protein LOC130902300 [Diorhabda carinulata]XP_057670308.1 uncharacterized protein LOC130902300 [Diorhabda carinulata]XP_057670309.1 uncharacterized protein LOC130902300 [Diorhabda carinulata]